MLGLVDQPDGVEEASDDVDVDRVDAGRLDPDPDLAGRRATYGKVGQLDGIGAGVADDGCAVGAAHGSSWVSRCGLSPP